MQMNEHDRGPEPIAIIGMAGRFPGAPDIAAFWSNLCNGVDSVTRFTAEQALAAGVDPEFVRRPNHVKAEAVLDDVAGFDAGFFGIAARDAEIMDPQQRICLECAWHALEDAGYDPARYKGRIGVFAGAAMSTYLTRNLLSHPGIADRVGGFELLIRNDKDFVPTLISHKLNLTGPSVAINSACSSSLVAVQLAVQSLLTQQCDMVLAGAVSVQVPQMQGHLGEPGSIYAPDGVCRPFDASARGTVGGHGAGMVVLKRMSDALADGDQMVALIRGGAVNNDGNAKVGYTAPSVTAQTAVVMEALAVAGVGADSIGMLEAHGTGTSMGDPIEIAALTAAFGIRGAAPAWCALGSVKGNVGHLNTAAGVASLIKAALSLQHRLLPPSLHFKRADPAAALERSPFQVNTALRAWQGGALPRRAGVSAFGIGGTNVHLVLEEPPARAACAADGAWNVLALSARSAPALAAQAARLEAHLRARPELALDDVAYTLALGRRAWPQRQVVLCRDRAGALAALAAPGPRQLARQDGRAAGMHVLLADRLPAHALACARAFHAAHPAFGVALAQCAESLALPAGTAMDLLDGSAGPALAAFSIQYALVQTAISWGVTVEGCCGVGSGEYLAACLTGVLSLSDALHLARERERIERHWPAGACLTLALPAERVERLLGPELRIVAAHGERACSVAGSVYAVDRLWESLQYGGVRTSVAQLEHVAPAGADAAVLDDWRASLRGCRFRMPSLPLASAARGAPLAPADAIDLQFWEDQLLAPSQLYGALEPWSGTGAAIVLDVAGQLGALCAATGLAPPCAADELLAGLDDTLAAEAGPAALAGALWSRGAALDWQAFYARARRRVPLPGYPFERQRYWVEPATAAAPAIDLAWLEQRERELARSLAVKPVGAYPGLRRQLDGLASALLCQYLAAAGIDCARGQRHGVAHLREKLGLLPAYRPFLRYMLEVLAEDGILSLRDETVEFIAPPHDGASGEALAALHRRYPGFRGLGDFLAHCASHYPRALSEPQYALGVLFPDGGGALMRRMLGEQTVEHTSTSAMVALMVAFARRRAGAAPEPLRVIEVGGGAGSLTWELARALGQDASFLFTDISQGIVSAARTRAGAEGLTGMQFATFDIARDPLAQGLQAGSFDLVVGLDILHVAPDVDASLALLGQLLKPGGAIALIETIAGQRWTNMMSGLTEGWWAFSDRRRTNSPLLSFEQWDQVLGEAGFEASAVLPRAPERRQTTDTALLLLAGPPRPDAAAPAGALPAKRTRMDDWFYAPSWKRVPMPPSGFAPARRQVLILADDDALGAELARRWQAAGAGVTLVRRRQGLALGGGTEYAIDPADPGHFLALVDALDTRGAAPDLVLHLWHAASLAGDPLDELDASQDVGLHSLLFLAQALGRAERCAPLDMAVVCSELFEVTGSEALAPQKATMLAPLKIIPREYPHIRCRLIEFDSSSLAGGSAAAAAASVMAELQGKAGDPFVAYRARHRWLPDHVALPLPGGVPTGLRHGGVYLITGGLGGLGQVIAGYLARHYQARLVLVGRSALPARAEWPAWLASHDAGDPVSARINAVGALEADGAEVEVCAADLADEAAMRAVVARALARFGAIHGVIHCAGIADASGVIHRRTRAMTEQALAAKVRGTLVLERVLAGVPLELMVLFSSIGSVLYNLKFGEVSYVAANDFVNAYAVQRARRGDCRVLSIAWTDWEEAGMWANAQRELARKYVPASAANPAPFVADLLKGMRNHEGTEAFARALAAPVNTLLVSTQDLFALLERHARFSAADHGQFLDRADLALPRHERAELASTFVGPRTPTEQAVCAIWQELLGVDRIGVDDDFMELGGDSLLAIRVIARLREQFGVDQSIMSLFEVPTVAQLAERVDTLRWASQGQGGAGEPTESFTL